MKINDVLSNSGEQLPEAQKPNEFDKIAHADNEAFRTKQKVIYLGPTARYPYKVVPWDAPGDPIKPDWTAIKQYISIGRELRGIKLDLARLLDKHKPGDKPPYTAAQLDRYRKAVAGDARLQALITRRDALEKELDTIKAKPQHMPAKAYVGQKTDTRSEIDRVFSKFKPMRKATESDMNEDVLNKLAALAAAANLGAGDMYKPNQPSDIAVIHGKAVKQYHFDQDPDAMPLSAEQVTVNGKSALLWQGIMPDGRRVQYWSYSMPGGMDEDQTAYLQDPLDPEGDTDGPGKTGDQWTSDFSEMMGKE